MDTQKPTGEKSAYTGRFADHSASAQPSASSALRQQTQQQARRPSGFASTPQRKPVKTASRQTTVKTADKAASGKKARSRKKSKASDARKRTRAAKPQKRFPFKGLIALIAAALAIYLLCLLLFGGEAKTVHQLPLVERESIVSFELEATLTNNGEDA